VNWLRRFLRSDAARCVRRAGALLLVLANGNKEVTFPKAERNLRRVFKNENIGLGDRIVRRF